MRRLLISFSRKMDEILAELRALRVLVADLHGGLPDQSDVKMCKGVTGKGTACRNRAGLGGEYCGMHNGRREPKEVKKVCKKVVKPKKVQPEHTHGIGEDPVGVCILCDTHGDVWDPELVDAVFEGKSIE